MKTHYDITDKYISVIHKKIIATFSTLSSMNFDEIENIQLLYKVFDNLKENVRKSYKLLAQKIYLNFIEDDEAITMEWLDENVLDTYNEVTKYIFNSEFDRKRDRLVETLIGTKGKDKEQITKSRNLIARQISQYGIEVTDKALIQAYKDKGYKKVVWNTAKDEKVCNICAKRDGTVYNIDNLPTKPHYNCRCWYTPYES